MLLLIKNSSSQQVIHACYEADGRTIKTYCKGLKSCDGYVIVEQDKIRTTIRINDWKEFQLFEETHYPLDDVAFPFDATLIVTPYYAGHDIKKIIKTIDHKTFIVDEKLPLQRVKDTLDTYEPKYNDILFYTAIEHIEKNESDKQYDTDMATKIELDLSHNHIFYKPYNQ